MSIKIAVMAALRRGRKLKATTIAKCIKNAGIYEYSLLVDKKSVDRTLSRMRDEGLVQMDQGRWMAK